MESEEKKLIKRIAKQDRRAFEKLFYGYYKELTQFAENYIHDRQASEDIVQSFFIYLWENSKSVNINTSLRSYLFQSIKNRCLNYLRSLQIRDKHNLLYIDYFLESHDPTWMDPKFSNKLKHAMSQLTRGMYDVLEQKYIFGKGIKEIAEHLEIQETTVKTQLYRAKKKLRAILLNASS